MLPKSKVEEYLQQGVHGAKETKPDERRRFLTTLRERVVVALKVPQVKEKQVYSEVKKRMEEYANAHLFLNGNIDYSYISKYISAAKKENIEFTIVTNKDHHSDLGLVLAVNEAIDKDDIFITNNNQNQLPQNQKEEKGLFFSLKKLLKK